MISGNPYKFAVLSGVINEWNLDETFLTDGELEEVIAGLEKCNSQKCRHADRILFGQLKRLSCPERWNKMKR